jgi:tRNA1Val (adenine37-N6)-methyltransferase
MKVCTDSCLFGAWIPVAETCTSILDIGTGTGLLSLMLAQRTKAAIDAVEIDEPAFLQAGENISNSVFSNSIHLYHQDIFNFSPGKQYDLIVCNPPFYEKQLQSGLLNERKAKHDSHFTLKALFSSIQKLISSGGKAALLLPYYRKDEVLKLAEAFGFFPECTLSVRQTPSHDFFRFAVLFSQHNDSELKEMSLSVKNSDNAYSAESTQLLMPFYLYL